MENATNEQSLRELLMENSASLIGCGLTVPLSLVTLDDRAVIIDAVLLHYVLLNSKAEIDQLLMGLSALDVLNTVKANSELFEGYFCIGHASPLVAGKGLLFLKRLVFNTVLSDDFRKLFKHVLYSDLGTNSRAKEEQTYMFFY